MDEFGDPDILTKISAEDRRTGTRLGTWAILTGAAGTAFEFLNECSLLAYLPGAAIRPMGVAYRSFLLAFITLIVALPLALSAIRVGRRWVLGLLALILATCPLPVAVLVGRFIITAQGLTLEP